MPWNRPRQHLEHLLKFTVSNWILLLVSVSGRNRICTCTWCLESVFLPFVAKWYILQQKCPKKWIWSPLLGTRRYLYNFQHLTQTLSVIIIHIATDRQREGRTDGRTNRRQYHANSRSYYKGPYNNCSKILNSESRLQPICCIRVEAHCLDSLFKATILFFLRLQLKIKF